tara:strand:- start:9694 stop:10530 length:837 start_codon:yes stop_codon:yes gene_type:complete
MREYVNNYKKNGFVLIKDFFSDNEIDIILIETKQIFSIALNANNIQINFKTASEEEFSKAMFKLFKLNYQAFLGAAKAAQHVFSLHQVACSEKMVKLLEDFGLKKPIICVKPIVYFNSRFLSKIEGHYKTPPHQDWRSMQGSLNSIVVWIPLIDINTNLGAVEFIKGSHLKGLYPTQQDDWFRHINVSDASNLKFSPVEVDRGDVVLFSAFTIHKSGNNITNKIRWSMHFRYNDVMESTFVRRNMPHPYIIYRPEQDVITKNFPEKDQLYKAILNEKN